MGNNMFIGVLSRSSNGVVLGSWHCVLIFVYQQLSGRFSFLADLWDNSVRFVYNNVGYNKGTKQWRGIVSMIH